MSKSADQFGFVDALSTEPLETVAQPWSGHTYVEDPPQLPWPLHATVLGGRASQSVCV